MGLNHGNIQTQSDKQIDGQTNVRRQTDKTPRQVDKTPRQMNQQNDNKYCKVYYHIKTQKSLPCPSQYKFYYF